MWFAALKNFSAAIILCSFFGFSSSAFSAVKIGVSDWPGWVAWYVAEQQGFFKKYGADVELVWFPNYTDSIQALSAGRLDANSQTLGDSMAPIAAGIPLKLILINDNSAGNDALLAKPAINTVKDLKGKTIALEEFSVSHFVLVVALAKHGMSPRDVKIVNLTAGDAAAAFLAGRVDACVVWNPWINKIISSGKGKALFTSKEMPGLIPDALVARSESIKAKRADLIGMVRAWYDAEKFIRENPQEAVKIMSKVVGLSADEYTVFLPGTRFFGQKENLQAFDAGNAESLLKVAPTIEKFLRDHKLLEGTLDVAKSLDASLVKEVAGVK